MDCFIITRILEGSVALKVFSVLVLIKYASY